MAPASQKRELGARMIVALGYYPGDQELAKKFASWVRDLGPNKGHTFLIARDVRCAGDESIKYDLEKVFDKVEVITIPEKVDGWKFAPNIVIRQIAVHIENTNPQPWLFLEPDVVILKSGWVDLIAKEYDEKKKPFLGDFVQVKDVIPHMSGVACYPGKVTDHAPNIKFAALSEIPWDVYAADQIVPKMAQTRYIAHRWLHPAFKNQSEVDNLLGQLGDTVIFHSDHSGTLIDFLRERKYGKPQQNAVQVKSETGIGTCDIFIKTYPKDYPWLEWCLRSISKFCFGFKQCIIATPNDNSDLRSAIVAAIASPINFHIEEIKEHGNDNYLSQQVFKMYADTYTDSDFIAYTDSDTIFTRPVTPETYMRNGKPIWWITPIDQAHPDQQHSWRKVMKKFLGKDSEFEFMRRFIFLVPRWALVEYRAFCEKQHGMPLDKYIMSQPYREFSEFNTLGHYLYEYHRDKFEWFDTSKHSESEWPELTVDQQWSHNPIPIEKWEQILASPVSSGEKQLCVQEKENLGDSKVGAERKQIRSMGAETLSPTLSGSEQQKSGTDDPQDPAPLPLNSLLEQVASHFTSPASKARVFKKLKSYPIKK